MTNAHLGSFWIFREGRKEVNGRLFLQEVLRALDDVLRKATNDNLIAALLLAGQLESALADENLFATPLAQATTDFVAALLVGDKPSGGNVLRSKLDAIKIPTKLTISPPEGFAYYALHPSDFVRTADEVNVGDASISVLGIRSIGTTLSAVVAAALRQKGSRVERITVRPTGHPYSRLIDFSPQQSHWIQNRLSEDSHFLVVDEGPGRSGSSFLSVAEALTRAGVSERSVTLIGSRAVNPADLCADNAVSRWSRFRFLCPATQTYDRFKHDFYAGGGEWRRFFQLDSAWPPCWPQMERLKFLSADRRHLFKFEGFGSFGRTVLERAQLLAHSGFSPAAHNAGDGMIRYAVEEGPPCAARQVSTALLQRIAEYCAFRSREFAFGRTSISQLEDMARFNLQKEFGADVEFPPGSLMTANPVLVDGRMQPHEWIRRRDSNFVKVDGTSHGDDHFFPGPADIAWDLAGAIVEWDLDESASQFLLGHFQRLTGDDARRRIDAFLLAYTVFRLGYCGMALTTVTGTPEEQRLARACEKYRFLASDLLRSSRLRRAGVAISSFATEGIPFSPGMDD